MFTLINSETGDKQTVSNIGELSDGYHSFNELYAHRVNLFAALMVAAHKLGKKTWWSHKHYDGELCFNSTNWCIGCIEVSEGKEIRYHFNIDDIKMTPVFASLELPIAASPRNGNTAEITLTAINELINQFN